MKFDCIVIEKLYNFKVREILKIDKKLFSLLIYFYSCAGLKISIRDTLEEEH